MKEKKWQSINISSTPQEIIESSGGPRHLSTIPLKNLFKIAESIINFYFKKKF